MPHDVQVVRGAEATAPLADAWNRLPLTRGVYADIYDTYAWFAAWLSAAPQGVAQQCRTLAVTEGDRVVALLPLLERSPGHWEPAGRGNFRPRFRPVLGSAEPEESHLDALAEAIAREGVRRLSLYRLPSLDPATPKLKRALERNGFTVDQILLDRKECLAEAPPSWEDYCQRFKDQDRKVRNSIRKAETLGPLSVEMVRDDEHDLLRAYETYLSIYPISWKVPPDEAWTLYRRRLLAGSAHLGLPRLYLLRLSGVPLAAHIWFRTGDVAISFSTVYGRSFAALGPGAVLRWKAQESLYSGVPPKILDYLPGQGTHKETLGSWRADLFALEAARRPVHLWGSRARRRVRGILRPLRERANPEEPEPLPPKTEVQHVRSIAVSPAPGRPRGEPSQIDPVLSLYLAVAAGHNSPKSMRDLWKPGDSWWWLPSGHAFVRVGRDEAETRTLREVIACHPFSEDWAGIAQETADQVGARITAELPGSERDPVGVPAPMHRAILPLPADFAASLRIGGLRAPGPPVGPNSS